MSVTYAGSLAVVILGAQPVGGLFADRVVSKTIEQDLQSSISNALALGEPKVAISSGMFSGARGFDFPAGLPQSAPPVIVGNYVMIGPAPGGQTQRFATVALVVERDTCFLRSASLSWSPGVSVPPSLTSMVGANIVLPDRLLERALSPVRLVVRGGARDHVDGARLDVDRARLLHEVYAAMNADRFQFPARSELLASACAHFAKKELFAPRLAHRDLVHDFRFGHASLKTKTPQARLAPLVPEYAPSCQIQTAPFGHALEVPSGPEDSQETLADGRQNSETEQGIPSPSIPWGPEHCLTQVVQRGQSILAPQLASEFQVIERKGRHVTLSVGRSSGLAVGARLVSATGARLHVIRIEAGPNGADRALAFIRHEPSERPLGLGDPVTFDPRVFP